MQLEIILLTFHLPYAIAQDFSWPMGEHGTGVGGGTRGQDQYHFEKDGTYPEKDFNPDANMQKRLVVEWGNVSRGYETYDRSNSKNGQYRRIWKDDNSLSRGHSLAIRGRLLIESVDGKTKTPIDWVQGVRVIISRKPDSAYDWSKRQEMHEAVWGDFVIWEKGEFLASISPGKLLRFGGTEEQFQVAMSLGDKKGKTITWKNTVGVLPQSVTKLKIPSPPVISKTMQIINGAPSYSQRDFNPAKLVRAVNHLMPMGKEKAIHELRQFLEIAHSSQALRIDENIDTSDRTCVFLIVRLLFESNNPSEELPDIRTVPFAPAPDESEKELWPLHPVYLQNDVPFFLVHRGIMAGVPTQPEWHLDWAEKHGKIRTKPLRPIDNPMIAAQRLISLPQSKRLYQDEFDGDYGGRALLLQQAWNAIEDADPSIPKPKPIPPANTWENPDWDARLKAASQLNIHWSETEQKYIMNEKK